MSFSIWRLTVSPPYPPSVASRSNTPVLPDSLSCLRAKLAISPPLPTRPSLPSSFLWYLSLLPSLVFHLSAWDFFLSSPALCSLASSHSTPPLSCLLSLSRPHLASSLFSLDLLFFFSQFHLLSLYPTPHTWVPINRASRGYHNGLLPLTLLQTHY